MTESYGKILSDVKGILSMLRILTTWDYANFVKPLVLPITWIFLISSAEPFQKNSHENAQCDPFKIGKTI